MYCQRLSVLAISPPEDLVVIVNVNVRRGVSLERCSNEFVTTWLDHDMACDVLKSRYNQPCRETSRLIMRLMMMIVYHQQHTALSSRMSNPSTHQALHTTPRKSYCQFRSHRSRCARTALQTLYFAGVKMPFPVLWGFKDAKSEREFNI